MKNIEEILNKYPFLRARDFDGTILLNNGKPELMGLEIPRGWHRLFLQLCEDIRPLLEKAGELDSFYFIQVKEKFNELRCYHNGAAAEVVDIIEQYEHMARFICTHCGKPATKFTTGYIASICDDCWKDKYRHQNVEHLRFEDQYIIKGFKNGETYTRTVSIKDKWQRYIEHISQS